MKVTIVAGCLALGFLATPASGQISEYTDCSEYDLGSRADGAPLTTQEKVERLDDTYYPKVAEITKCEENSRDEGASSGGTATSTERVKDVPGISSNRLEPGKTSIAVTNTVHPTAVSIIDRAAGNASSSGIDESITGRDHEELDEADNTAALRAQIKAQIDIETDPDIKEQLIKQYEALK